MECVHFYFYQEYWSIIGREIVAKVLDILNNEGEIGNINQTHIVLIPKKKKM